MDGFVDNWQLQDSFRFSQSIRDSLGSVVFEMYPWLTRLLFARCSVLIDMEGVIVGGCTSW